MKKLLPTLFAVVPLIGAAFSSEMQALFSAHPVVSLAVTTAIGVVNHWLPSPNSASSARK